MRPVMELKQDMDMVANLGDIIDILKTSTLIRFKLFQSREKPLTDFASEAEIMFSALRVRLEEVNSRHPFFYQRESLPSLIVLVSSDEGFLGEINTLLINAALDQRRRPDDAILVLGERGARFLEDIRLTFDFLPGLSDEIGPVEVEKIRDYILEAYCNKFGRVVIVYPAFISLMTQKITVWDGLPCQSQGTDIASKQGDIFEDMLVEPSVPRVLEGAVELWFGSKLLQIFWSAKLAEYAARIMHLEGGGQELSFRRRSLSTEYFRQVHTLRDKSIREIAASRHIVGVR